MRQKYAEIEHSHKSDTVRFFGEMDSTAVISTFKLTAKLESNCGFTVARSFADTCSAKWLYSIFLHLKLDFTTNSSSESAWW